MSFLYTERERERGRPKSRLHEILAVQKKKIEKENEKNCQYDKTLYVVRIVKRNVLKQVIDMRNVRVYIFEF